MPTKEEILSALFPRTVDATYAGSGLARRSLAGTLDAASLPGRAYSSLWHRYEEPMLQNMARTGATPGSSLAAGVAEGMARDPLTLLSAPVGGLAGSGGRALASGVGSAMMRRALPVAADAAANTGLAALAQYGTEGRVAPGALAANAGIGLGMQGLGSAVAKMAPKGRAAILENPNFRKWFGESKVLDETGNPLVVYHGTNGDFDKFDPKLSRDIGIHFGTAEQANTFGNNVMPSYLQLKNPLQVEDRFSRENGLSAFLEDAYYDLDMTPAEADKFRKLAKASESKWSDSRDIDNTQTKEFKAFWSGIQKVAKRSGYDGIQYKNAVEGVGNSYAVFDPTQIKSAIGNRGTFDPNDPNITHFAGGQSPIAGANALAGRYFRGLLNQDEKKEKR